MTTNSPNAALISRLDYPTGSGVASMAREIADAREDNKAIRTFFFGTGLYVRKYCESRLKETHYIVNKIHLKKNDKRFYFKLEYEAVHEAVGPDYPVLIKLGLADGFAGGLALEEGLQGARELARLGFDVVEVSQGLRGIVSGNGDRQIMLEG